MDIGQDIGCKARLLFSGGATVDEEPWQHAQAVARTTTLMGDKSIPAIFEAAFEYDAIRIRVDLLERLDGDAWGLREVKSSTGLKDHYLDDLALQAFVLKGVGVPVTSVELVHVNSAYVRGPGGICWADFFTRLDVGDAVATRLIDLPCRLPAMRDCLRVADQPYAEPGEQCGTPHGCEFWDRCTADKPADWISYLPRLSQARASELKTRGIEAISAIPSDFPLTSKQAIIRDATATGRPYVSPDLAHLLLGCGPPACYLDFEAMMPPIPLYEGTRPYQTIPFQWSLHAVTRGGELSHREFLAEAGADPRRRFAETLVVALHAFDGPIIVYSAYEQTRLRELAREFADLGESLNAIIARLVDLLPIVRAAVYFPEFDFNNSIKSVAPALCPGFGYDDLEDIADGAAASAAFLQLASSCVTDLEEADRLRAALLAYCQRDTLAMVRVHRALMGLVDQI
jgi:predicted RecB family nuclease